MVRRALSSGRRAPRGEASTRPFTARKVPPPLLVRGSVWIESCEPRISVWLTEAHDATAAAAELAMTADTVRKKDGRALLRLLPLLSGVATPLVTLAVLLGRCSGVGPMRSCGETLGGPFTLRARFTEEEEEGLAFS